MSIILGFKTFSNRAPSGINNPTTVIENANAISSGILLTTKASKIGITYVAFTKRTTPIETAMGTAKQLDLQLYISLYFFLHLMGRNVFACDLQTKPMKA